MAKELSQSMSLEEFDNGYWYAEDLKKFAKKIGVPRYSQLRKDELEKIIKSFLQTGKIAKPVKRKSAAKSGLRDSDKGLSLELHVENYVNDKATKEFILAEAKKVDPKFRIKPGTRYLLNRWREEQLSAGRKISYGDLVTHIMALAKSHKGPLRTEHGRYNNFISDFMANKHGTREEAVTAWNELKELDLPKTYADWVKYQDSRSI